MACLVRFMLAALVAMLATAAAAQSYPTRPIRLIVGFPPGGATDVIARVVGQPLAARLGQPVVIENRPGSNGNIAGELVAKARPDGYTLLLGPDSLFAVNPHLYAKMPIDPLKDLVPVASLVISNQVVLAVNPATAPVNDLARVRRAGAAQRPRRCSMRRSATAASIISPWKCSSSAPASTLTHVPYKGGGAAAIAVMAGEVIAMFGGGSMVPLVKSGRLKALAVSGSKRWPSLPELPTIAETYPGYEVTIWQGLFVPAGTPPAIIERLRGEVNAVLAQPEVGERLIAAGAGEPTIMAPDEFAALIRNDRDRYRALIKEIGVTVD